MTIEQVAAVAGLKPETIRHYHKQGQGGLPAPDAVFGRTPVWEQETIVAWLASRRGPGRPLKKDHKQ